MRIGVIGRGAIAQFVKQRLAKRGHTLVATLLTPDRVSNAGEVGSVRELPEIDIMLDCAGHQALAEHGPALLERGIDIITVSIGALADNALADRLETAANQGDAKLHLASGAIGALDALSAACCGDLHTVTYTGRKPPLGWKGSPAEAKIDLDLMTEGAELHFEGTAREAALAYPKNANVAAAVALAGLGFDDTQVRLIADATITRNIHEVAATGDFGDMQFQIGGNALPDNPRSSALAAMSVLAKLDQISGRVTL